MPKNKFSFEKDVCTKFTSNSTKRKPLIRLHATKVSQIGIRAVSHAVKNPQQI